MARRSSAMRWLACVGALLFAGCGESLPAPRNPALAEPDPSDPVAFVDQTSITASAVRREIVKRGLTLGEGDRDQNARRELLADLIDSELIAGEAARRKLDQDPALVADFKKLLVAKYWEEFERANADRLAVEESDVRAYYDAHDDEFEQPAMVRVSLIAIKRNASAPVDELQKAREQARSLRAAVMQDPGAFPVLAREHSAELASARRGGDVGWVAQGTEDYRWEPEVIEAAFELDDTGDVSPVIETQRALYLVRVSERREAKRRAFEAVRDEIYQRLLREKQEDLREQILASLREGAQIHVDQDALEAIGSNAQTASSRPPSFPVEVP